MGRFSNILSYLLHPLFVPTYAIAFVLFYFRNVETSNITFVQRLLVLSSAALTTVLVPAFLILYLKMTKYIKSLKMETREERTYPLAITTFSSFATAYMLYQENYPYFMFKIVLISGCIMMVAFLINLKWKISLHALGISGLVGIVFRLIPYSHKDIIPAFLIMIILAGLLGSARLRLDAHKPEQVYFGYLIGWLLSIILFQLI